VLFFRSFFCTSKKKEHKKHFNQKHISNEGGFNEVYSGAFSIKQFNLSFNLNSSDSNETKTYYTSFNIARGLHNQFFTNAFSKKN